MVFWVKAVVAKSWKRQFNSTSLHSSAPASQTQPHSKRDDKPGTNFQILSISRDLLRSFALAMRLLSAEMARSCV